MSCLRPAHIYCLDKSTASLLLVIRPSIWTSLKLAKNISALNLSGTYQSSQEGVRASSLAVQRPPVASRTTWTLLPTPPQDQRPCRTWGGCVCRWDEATGQPPQSWGDDPTCHHPPLRPTLGWQRAHRWACVGRTSCGWPCSRLPAPLLGCVLSRAS